MENIQLIRSRIKGIASTRQITQSMRLVSTAKVQKARGKMEQNRLFSAGVRALLDQAVPAFRFSRHPYLGGNGGGQRGEKPAAVIVVASDRGLCGGYNINVGKQAQELLEQLGQTRLVAVGSKAGEALKGMDIARSFTGVCESPFFEDAWEIAALALNWYNRGEVGAVYLVFTRFESLLKLTPAWEKLLPLELEAPEGIIPPPVPCEPEEDVFLERLVPFVLSSRIYAAMLESSACEQSARITSMDAAVKNADEMIADLSLLYNQARQGAITQEITEIVGGADAIAQQ